MNGFSKFAAAAWIASLALGPGAETAHAQTPARTRTPAVVPSEQAVVLSRADESRTRGDAAATLRILEVSDFECPFCAQFFRETLPGVDSLYVKTGKAKYVWISFPNAQHHRAWPAIEAAFCAGAVDKFWPMHDMLFANQKTWTKAKDPNALFIQYAVKLGIEPKSFAACLREDLPAPLQVQDLQAAMGAGIQSTPFFVVGDSLAIRGAVPLAEFRHAVDSLLVARKSASR